MHQYVWLLCFNRNENDLNLVSLINQKKLFKNSENHCNHLENSFQIGFTKQNQNWTHQKKIVDLFPPNKISITSTTTTTTQNKNFWINFWTMNTILIYICVTWYNPFFFVLLNCNFNWKRFDGIFAIPGYLIDFSSTVWWTNNRKRKQFWQLNVILTKFTIEVKTFQLLRMAADSFVRLMASSNKVEIATDRNRNIWIVLIIFIKHMGKKERDWVDEKKTKQNKYTIGQKLAGAKSIHYKNEISQIVK